MIRSIILILLLSITILSTVTACEICGCGNGNFQIGILPNFHKGFIGLRYSTSKYNSVLSTDATQFSRDYYQSTELWGGYNFKNLQIMGFVPYLFNKKVSDDGITRSNGLGDLLILANYKVWSATSLNKTETTTFRNDVFVGGGIKLPTGVNKVDVSNQDFNMGDFNSQPGTGSVDFLVNVTHNLMWNKSGIVTNLAYRVNTANNQDYKFGNRTYANTAYYYTLNIRESKLKPNAGINYQSNAVNSYTGSAVTGSNGYNFNATVGMNFLYKKIGINAMAFIPVTQNMYQGQTKLDVRTTVGLTYSF